MTKKNKNKKKNFKEFFKSTKFLTIIFILLIVLVSILVVLCVIRSDEAKENGFANMRFDLVGDNKPIDFGINALTLSQTDEYIFKVTNFKGNKINKKEKKYTVTIENETDCVISVTVNDLDQDVMTNQESTILTDTLKGKEKEAVYFHVKVKSAGELNDKDLIKVQIEES